MNLLFLVDFMLFFSGMKFDNVAGKFKNESYSGR